MLLMLLFVCICCFCTYFTYCVIIAAWLDKCDSKIIYERRMQSQVLYVVPITSILGRLALVPVGDTGTIPFSMRNEKTTILARYAIPKGAQVTAIDGGT